MRLTFRQGIARYQTDVYATPVFLQRSSQTGEFVDLIVSPDPTVIIFAHKNATYVIEETKTVRNAWGPFLGSGSCYLYWDINLLNASVTRGFTNYPQIISGSPPENPAVDQHWFDTSLHQMKVWNGSKWVDKVRVFAAKYSSRTILQPYPLGTQVGETGTFEGGNLILDSYNKPLRQSDGTFLTSSTELSIINASTKKVKLESEVFSGMASENIPKFSFVQANQGKQFKLARSDEWRSRIIGVVTEDLYTSEVGDIQTSGLVRNEQWSWPTSSIGRPIFCGATGQITLVPPSVGVLQIGGYIYDTDSVFLNIQQATILSDVRQDTVDLPTGPVGVAPVANFTSSSSIGTAPLSILFNDASLHNATSWKWDFNNNGSIDSTVKNPTHVFTTPGTYSVKLTVKNEHGEDTITKVGFITVNAALPRPGINTNLNIQLSAPLQVNTSDNFAITVNASNVGYQAATNVARAVFLESTDNGHLDITAKPTGSVVTHSGNITIIALPVLASMPSGQHISSTFNVTAPNDASIINIRAGVVSPENDSELSDNLATLSIRVKYNGND